VGAWTCIACATANALGTDGQAVSAHEAGWCGVGGHAVKGERVRWAPTAKAGVTRSPPVTPAPAKLAPVQGELF